VFTSTNILQPVLFNSATTVKIVITAN